MIIQNFFYLPQESSSSSTAPDHSIRQQFASWWSLLPLVTKSVFSACVLCYVLSLTVIDQAIGRFCFAGARLFSSPLAEAWRGITAPFFHLSLLHLVFNMLAFLPTAAHIERATGSLVAFSLFWGLVLAGTVLNGILATALSLAHALSPSCAAGLSGVIFGLICIDNHAIGGTRRSIYGMFEVPKALYPWVLLVLIQLLAPQVSFLGHVSGLLAGELYARGLLGALTVSAARAQALEGRPWMAPVLRCPGYLGATGSDLASLILPGLPTIGGQGGGSGGFPMPGAFVRGGYGANLLGGGLPVPFRGAGRTLGGAGGAGTAAAALDRRPQEAAPQALGYANLSGGPPVPILTPGPPAVASGAPNPSEGNPFMALASGGGSGERGSGGPGISGGSVSSGPPAGA